MFPMSFESIHSLAPFAAGKNNIRSPAQPDRLGLSSVVSKSKLTPSAKFCLPGGLTMAAGNLVLQFLYTTLHHHSHYFPKIKRIKKC